MLGDGRLGLARDLGEGEPRHQRLDLRQRLDELPCRLGGEAGERDLLLRGEARQLDLGDRLALDRLNPGFGHLTQLVPTLLGRVLAAPVPPQIKPGRKALRDADLVTARGDLLVGLSERGLCDLGRPLPNLVLIERELLAHLVLEVSDQLGRALLGGALEHLLALANEPLQVLALVLTAASARAWRA